MMSQHNKFYFMLGLALCAWAIIFYQGIITAVDVWLVSEVFNHCLFVLPFSLYLIYQKRKAIQFSEIKPTLLPLLPLIGAMFLQLFALVGDIKILMHIATFTALPLIIWLVLGHKVSKLLAFPLFFILFCIPIGDQLVPYLQELTTDLSVPLLEFTNVPVYRNGLYLDIPEGRFLVAEACSGISFLISSIVFGFAYAYLSFNSVKKRSLFVALSISVPIIANAIRVYGIVLTGHLSDMQYAVGADHLIYGGVFYTIVLFILIMIGERFRDKQSKVPEEAISKNNLITTYNILPVACFILLSFAQQLWLHNINNSDKPYFSIPENVNTSHLNYQEHGNTLWQPSFKGADRESTGRITTSTENKLDAYIAYYNGSGAELISSNHRLYQDKQWSLVSHKNKDLEGKSYTLTELAAQSGQRRYLLHWYEINGQHFNSTTKAKLYQAYLMLLGKNASGVKIILSAPKEEMASIDFITHTEMYIPAIRHSLYQALNKQ